MEKTIETKAAGTCSCTKSGCRCNPCTCTKGGCHCNPCACKTCGC